MEAYSLWVPPSPNNVSPDDDMHAHVHAHVQDQDGYFSDGEVDEEMEIDIGARDEYDGASLPVVGLGGRIEEQITAANRGRIWADYTDAAISTGHVDLEQLERDARNRYIAAQAAAQQAVITAKRLNLLVDHYRNKIPKEAENARMDWWSLKNPIEVSSGNFCRVLKAELASSSSSTISDRRTRSKSMKESSSGGDSGRRPGTPLPEADSDAMTRNRRFAAVKLPKVDNAEVVKSQIAIETVTSERFVFARQLRHPFVLSFIGWGTVPADDVVNRSWGHTELPFLTMEWKDWCLMDVLESLLRNGNSPPPDLVWYWIEAISIGLHHLHCQRLLHRDIKASNILLELESLKPVIADFGLSVFWDESDVLPPSTPVIQVPAAPELRSVMNMSVNANTKGQEMDRKGKGKGKLRPGPPADVWGLGILMWEIDNLRAAAKTEGIMSILPPPASSTVNDPLKYCIAWCCQADPVNRPAPGDVVVWIRKCREEGSIPPHPPPEMLLRYSRTISKMLEKEKQ